VRTPRGSWISGRWFVRMIEKRDELGRVRQLQLSALSAGNLADRTWAIHEWISKTLFRLLGAYLKRPPE
jgi:hypothetical protein